MAIEVYSTFPKTPGLEPHHQFIVISKTVIVGGEKIKDITFGMILVYRNINKNVLISCWKIDQFIGISFELINLLL